MARDYGRANGFKGTFYIEPKPMEPTKHQYDFDVETVAGFLRANGLDKDFRMNIEANHGARRNGWDTDQFPNSYYETTLAMLTVLKVGGFRAHGFRRARERAP